MNVYCCLFDPYIKDDDTVFSHGAYIDTNLHVGG